MNILKWMMSRAERGGNGAVVEERNGKCSTATGSLTRICHWILNIEAQTPSFHHIYALPSTMVLLQHLSLSTPFIITVIVAIVVVTILVIVCSFPSLCADGTRFQVLLCNHGHLYVLLQCAQTIGPNIDAGDAGWEDVWGWDWVYNFWVMAGRNGHCHHPSRQSSLPQYFMGVLYSGASSKDIYVGVLLLHSLVHRRLIPEMWKFTVPSMITAHPIPFDMYAHARVLMTMMNHSLCKVHWCHLCKVQHTLLDAFAQSTSNGWHSIIIPMLSWKMMCTLRSSTCSTKMSRCSLLTPFLMMLKTYIVRWSCGLRRCYRYVANHLICRMP